MHTMTQSIKRKACAIKILSINQKLWINQRDKNVHLSKFPKKIIFANNFGIINVEISILNKHSKWEIRRPRLRKGQSYWK